MPSCSFGECHSNSRQDHDIQFIAFPKPWRDEARAKRWAFLMGRGSAFTSKEIGKNSYVCSLHFNVPPGTELDWRKNKDLEPMSALKTRPLLPLRKTRVDSGASSSKEVTGSVDDIPLTKDKGPLETVALKTFPGREKPPKTVVAFLPVDPQSTVKIR